MAKREEVHVDEELIRSMIRGDAVYQSEAQAKPAVSESVIREPAVTKSADKEPAATPPLKESTQPGAEQKRPSHTKKRAKDGSEAYDEKFLVNDMCKNRVSANISRELFNKLRKLLSIMSPEVTLTSYLNNIIADHLDQNWGEITDLYDNERNKPL